jgi:AcrR family transcriptional regulator
VAVDHRVRTGAARREATKQKLLVAAVRVFAEKGIDSPLIDDFIAAAGVARGTFYNYFKTTNELLEAVSAELSDEVMAGIDARVQPIEQPIERIATGCLLYMHIAVTHPAWGTFIAHTSTRGASGKLIDDYLPRDIAKARDLGQARITSVRAARDVVLGGLRHGIDSVVNGIAPPEHVREVLRMVLAALGVREAMAKKLAAMPVPAVPLPPGIQALERAADGMPRTP